MVYKIPIVVDGEIVNAVAILRDIMRYRGQRRKYVKILP